MTTRISIIHDAERAYPIVSERIRFLNVKHREATRRGDHATAEAIAEEIDRLMGIPVRA